MRNTHKNIFLIGFMGSGKTSVSAAMGRLYGKNVIEIDDQIVAREGRSVKQIFEESGEEYFRNCETELLCEITLRSNAIVSCGGGIVLRPQNVKLMKENGVIVLLEAEAGTIYGRVKDENVRPILNGNMSVEYIQELKQKRAHTYQHAADLVIRTDRKTIEQVAGEVYESVYRAG